MNELNLITIDAIENVSVSRKDFRGQLQMLYHLEAGLYDIYEKFKEVENRIQSKHERPVQCSNEQGLLFHVSKKFHALLPCHFHWFSVSLCNYARLVGYLKGLKAGELKSENFHITAEEAKTIKQQGLDLENVYKENKENRSNIKDYCTSYVESIAEIKSVLAYRHKVSAHFALTDPRAIDTFATLDYSAINLIGLLDSKLVSKASTYIIQDTNNRLVAEDIPVYSVTEVYEALASRFWPDFVLPTKTSGESFVETNEREKKEKGIIDSFPPARS